MQGASRALSLYILIYSFACSFVRSSSFYHSAEVIIFLGLSSVFFRQQFRLSIVVKSRKTPLVVLNTFPKKVKSELLWQLHHFLPFPYSLPVPMLCFSILLALFFFFMLCFSLLDIFSVHSVTATAKIGSFYVFGNVPTYPSPTPTLRLNSRLGQNIGLGEGWVGSFPRNLNCGMPVLLAP